MDVTEAKEFFDKLGFIDEQQRLIINSQDDLIQEVISQLCYDSFDYSMNAVVFPGKRPAYYLIKKLADKCGCPLIPPKIFSIDEFVNFLFKKIDNSDFIEPVDGVGIIYKICRENDFLSSFFSKFDNFISYGFKLFNLFEELYIEDISIEKLKNLESLIDIPINSKKNLRFLSRTYELFYKELIENKLSTRSLRYRRVSDSDIVNFEDFRKIIFAGFYGFTESEKRILRKLATSDYFLFIFQERSGFSEDKIKFYSCPDSHGEIKIAGSIVKKIITDNQSNIDEKTVIVLPSSDNLFPLIRQGIPYLSEENYNISMGYPLTRTPIYGFFLSFFELLSSVEEGRIYVPLYLKFILHPYTKNILFKNSAELSRIILHEIDEFFSFEETPKFVGIEWIEREIPKKIAAKLYSYGISEKDIREHINFIHENTINKFKQLINIEDFIKKCREVLFFVYEKSTAPLHPLFYPYVEAFLIEFDKLSHSIIKNFSFEFHDSYFNFFKNFLLSANIPFAGTPLKGLQILGFLETRNIKFDRVIFLNLNEDIFPDLSEDYLLPYTVRKTLGLPTYREREKLIYHYFSVLIEGAKEVHLIYVKNDKQERSRFIEKIIWEIEKNKAQRYEEETNFITLSNYKVNLADKFPEAIYKTEETMKIIQNLSLSATSLDDYLKCGIRFYYSNIVGLKKDREISSDLGRSEIGTIVHESLKEYFKLRVNKKLKEIDLTDDIEEIVDNFFLQKYGEKITGKAYLLRLQILRRLRDVINYYRDFLKKKDLLVLSVEEYFEEESWEAKIKCIIDRVDRIDDKIYILDYKTTGNEEHFKINFDKLIPENKASWAKAIGSLQIPLYMILYSKRFGLSVKNLYGCYFLLGKPSIDSSNFLNPFSEIEKEKELSTLSLIIQSLIREIKDPSQPFVPTEDFKNVCRHCDYKPFCGTLTVPSNTSSAGPVI